jgi:ectoine hydroxylase-related dioxygenase (phytanoyl-CoA dioxygenase family)
MRTIEEQYRLNDDQILDFIVQGYVIIEPELPEGFNESICDELDKLEDNPLDEILDVVPKLKDVFAHPKIVAAFASLLGDDYQESTHRHWHLKPPNSSYMHWHQDGINNRNVTEIHTLLALYYPQEVTFDMGPTVIVPGTHFRNAPTDRMANHFNIKGQIPLVVKAGTMAVTVYSLWHGTFANTTDKKRHMIKMPISRSSDPVGPSWRHDNSANEKVAGGSKGGLNATMLRAQPVPAAQSDNYKERRLRRMTWDWMCGKGEQV